MSTVADAGTSCRLTSRRSAVTTTSSSTSLLDVSCAYTAGDSAAATANPIMVERRPRIEPAARVECSCSVSPDLSDSFSTLRESHSCHSTCTDCKRRDRLRVTPNLSAAISRPDTEADCHWPTGSLANGSIGPKKQRRYESALLSNSALASSPVSQLACLARLIDQSVAASTRSSSPSRTYRAFSPWLAVYFSR